MRQIDWDSALSEDDVTWLRTSGMQYAPNGQRLEDAIKSNQDKDYSDPDEGVNPARSALDSTAQGAPPIGTLSADEQIELLNQGQSTVDEDDDYENWKRDELVDEIGARNDQDGTSMSTSGTKAELAARLREDDKRRNA